MITLPLTLLLLGAVVLLSFQRGRFHGGTTTLAIITGMMIAHTGMGRAITDLVTGSVHLIT